MNYSLREILATIANGENQTTEFKISFQKEVIESVVAFANSCGGKIFVGIKDDGSVCGVTNATESVKNSNHVMSLDEISNEHLKTINSSWDYYVDDRHDFSDISQENISNLIEKIENYQGIKFTDDPLTILRKHELIKGDKLTFGAYLLLQVTTEFIKKHLMTQFIITGEPQRSIRYDYLLEAIREIVINMIVHRDSDGTLKKDSLVVVPKNFTLHNSILFKYIANIKEQKLNTIFRLFCKEISCDDSENSLRNLKI